MNGRIAVALAALLTAAGARAQSLPADLEAVQRRVVAVEDAAAADAGSAPDRALSAYLGELSRQAQAEPEGPGRAALARSAAELRRFVETARWTEEDEKRAQGGWLLAAEKAAAFGTEAAPAGPRAAADNPAFGELSAMAGALAPAPAAGIGERIALAAEAAPGAAGEGTLYGYQTWTSDTLRTIAGLKYPGMLSCAITVSAILNKAGRGIGRHFGVDDLRSSLGGWKTISDAAALERGDVVFWKATQLKAELLWKMGHYPRGQYPQHVGIYVGVGSTVDNNALTGKPERQSLSRWGNDFNGARRAR